MNGQKKLGKMSEEEKMEAISREIEEEFGEEGEHGVEEKQFRGEQIEEIAALQDELQIPMEKILDWTDKKFAAKKIEELSEDQAETVIRMLKAIKEKRENEKGKGEQKEAEANFTKVIDIAWDDIPKQILIPKLKKAMEYYYEMDAENGIFLVKKKSGEGKIHTTISNSCDCGDWINRGNSLNPCTHMIRIWYSDGEIQEMLKQFGAEDLPAKHKEREELMPFSERDTNSDMCIRNITPHLAEIGKIKIGSKGQTKTKTGFLLPEKWDHFEIATLVKDNEGRLEIDNEMTARIGKNCKALDVELCYDSPVMNMPNFYALLSEGKIMCRGNGVVATKTKKDESKEEIVCNPKTCEAYQKKKCKLHGRLSVILSASNRLGGVYVFRTSGFNSIRNIMSSMGFLRGITGGVLGGIPLRLTLLPMTVKPQGVTRNVKIYAVNLEYTGSPAELKNAAVEEIQRRMQLGVDMVQTEKEDKDLLQAQVIEEAEEEAKAEEFIPEGE